MPISEDHGAGDLAEADLLRLAGVGAEELLVEVDRDQRRGRVEHRREVGHQRGGHRGEDQAAQARRDQVLDERQVGGVAARELGVEGEGDDAGDREEERGDDVQEPGADHAHPGVVLVLRRQHALDDVLRGARVPQPHGQEAGEHAGDGEPLVGDREEDLELLGVVADQVREARRPGRGRGSGRGRPRRRGRGSA